MRLFGALFVMVTLTCVFSTPVHAGDGGFVQIRRPFANIYEYLDPQSRILEQAKKNSYYELVYEGTSWYQIKVGGKVGWIEKRAGAVVDRRGVTVFSIPVGTFLLFLLLLIGTIGGASLLIYRQKTAEI